MDDAPYQALSADERRDALQVAARSSGHRTYVLEKDIWIVATLGILFEAPFGQHLVFKGGTSLSKVWRALLLRPDHFGRAVVSGRLGARTVIVVSNDSDIAEAMRLVRRHHGKRVGSVTPGTGRASRQLMAHADFSRHLRPNALGRSRLPDRIPGTNIRKPARW